MGITRMGDLKRAKSGARSVAWRNKRNHAVGRPAANTRIGEKRIHLVRTRGGNYKRRALRLDHGTFSWASENVSRKTRILSTVYHPSDNEFVRTNTLTKGSIVSIDSAPFKQWYERHYGKGLGRSQYEKPANVSERVKQRWEKLANEAPLANNLVSQFDQGRVLAAIASRPGQCGRADGYILEGEELDFYMARVSKKGKK
ncbi:40S ribosomal protein S8-B [Histomonas meleagridis]|uniref:40S ribosomal protein S8-B n=2 Tax=Histomonas meleagridis TaxID=135588 RepID=UPI00355A65F3|nr:40S ribosomal protein S8-B [Histomonas meleagridis]KAH0790207.1 40S ribosomal protein S8-B [Histomonas meleagridis]KAH0790780.1 40S ribosomal protein S8-B [Histomonas meleagridis]KAH0794001.1 40S ribosomal protein S8-B [Histomonas meleagridis]KAH0795433.1 40S ribosomal protein S8-B [Histomonas meleagridis]